jgi:hypothetical protein
MLCISKTIFVYQFYKILVIEPTTEVKAESIGAPSVEEITANPVQFLWKLWLNFYLVFFPWQ